MPRTLRIEYPGAIYHVLNSESLREQAVATIAGRVRAETSVTLKGIAEHLQIGTWTHVANRFSQNPDPSNNQPVSNLC